MADYISYKKCFVAKTKEEEEGIQKAYQTYTNLISTLPRARGFTSKYLCQYQGFWHEEPYCQAVLAAQDHFKARSSDFLLASTPKSGSTWLKALMFAVLTRNMYPLIENPLLTVNPHDLVPELELRLYSGNRIPNLDILPSPRLLGTHIPYTSLPQSIIDSGCRIVYLSRNPKDVFVSFWHFINKVRDRDSKMALPIEEPFDLFCKGISIFGPFWDHVLGYYRESLRMPQCVLFLRYEEMLADPVNHLKRLAEFMGCPFTSEEVREGVVDGIIKLCSFQNMSNLEVNKTTSSPSGLGYQAYFRQGKVGDWAIHLTPEMIERVDQITEEKFQSSGLTL